MAITNLTWPLELPQQFLIDGFSQVPAKFKVRTEMDAAVAKQRPRFSTVAKPFMGRMLMTNEQYLLFQDFFDNTLMIGSLEFNMPVVGDSTTYQVVRFTEENYDPAPIGILWDVRLNLEQIP